MAEQGGNKKQINIELDENTGQGTYSNSVIITHNGAEFVVDFLRMLPGVPKAKVHSRVIMTPQHVKSFLNALTDNVEKYEKMYGEIRVETGPKPDKPFGFQA